MEPQLQELIPDPSDPKPSVSRSGTRAAARTQPGGRRIAATVDPSAAALRRFVDEHPDGWNHDQWLELLTTLRAAGQDTTDSDAIGLTLERERLTRALTRIRGLGHRRQATVIEAYPRLWDLQQAKTEDLANLPGINVGLASRIVEEVRRTPERA